MVSILSCGIKSNLDYCHNEKKSAIEWIMERDQMYSGGNFERLRNINDRF
jgi:hypothetical protein